MLKARLNKVKQMKTASSTYAQVAPDTYAVVRILSALFCAALPFALTGCNDGREHDAGVYGAVGVKCPAGGECISGDLQAGASFAALLDTGQPTWVLATM